MTPERDPGWSCADWLSPALARPLRAPGTEPPRDTAWVKLANYVLKNIGDVGLPSILRQTLHLFVITGIDCVESSQQLAYA